MSRGNSPPVSRRSWPCVHLHIYGNPVHARASFRPSRADNTLFLTPMSILVYERAVLLS
jgi:hypothetical protein